MGAERMPAAYRAVWGDQAATEFMLRGENNHLRNALDGAARVQDDLRRVIRERDVIIAGLRRRLAHPREDEVDVEVWL